MGNSLPTVGVDARGVSSISNICERPESLVSLDGNCIADIVLQQHFSVGVPTAPSTAPDQRRRSGQRQNAAMGSNRSIRHPDIVAAGCDNAQMRGRPDEHTGHCSAMPPCRRMRVLLAVWRALDSPGDHDEPAPDRRHCRKCETTALVGE